MGVPPTPRTRLGIYKVTAVGLVCLYWLHQWGIPHRTYRFYLLPAGDYKESTLFFDFSFWLHQGGIPHRSCRFYCSLRGHQRTGTKDSAEPSFAMEPRLRGSLDSTSSTRGVRCGGAFWLPRLTGIQVAGIRCRSIIPSSEFCAAICVRAMVVRVSVGLLGLYRTFFIIGGIGCSFLRLLLVLLWLFVGFALTAIGSFLWADNGVG